MISISELKKRSDLHLARKLWHITGVFSIAVLYNTISINTSIALFAIVSGAAIILDILRQKSERFNDILVHIFKPIMRQGELNGLAGTSYLFLGVFIIVFFFPREVVTLTLLFLALGDPCASYFGIRYGKDKILGEKSLQGSVAAFIICAIAAFIYLYRQNMMNDRLVIVSVLSGLAGAMAELLPIGKLDDNLTLPVISASSLWIIFWLFGGLS